MTILTDLDPVCQKLITRGGWREALILLRCKFPIEPRNTFSNLAYVGAAAVLFWNASSVSHIIMGLSLLTLGAGSFLYHGTKRGWAQQLDNAGMYAVFTTLVIHGVLRNPDIAGAIAAPLAGFLAWRYAYKVKMSLEDVMGLFLAIGLLRPLFEHNTLQSIGVLIVFGAAYTAWQIDKCSDRLGLWGHAIWHVLTAVAILWTFFIQIS